MTTYHLKRKTFGMLEAGQNVLGGVAGGVGKAMDSTPAAIAGGAHGFVGPVGSTIGSALSAAGVPGGAILGRVIGAGVESAAVRGIGKGLKNASDSLS